MKAFDEHKLDELFRQKLTEADIPYDTDDWLNLQRKLAERNKHRYFFTGISIGAAAAVALLLASWWALRPDATLPADTPVPMAVTGKPAQGVKQNLTAGGSQHTNGAARVFRGSPAYLSANLPVATLPAEVTAPTAAITGSNDPEALPEISFAALAPSPATVLTAIAIEPSPAKTGAAEDQQEPAKPEPFVRRSTLGVLAAPDYNAAGNFRNMQPGYSAGVGFAADLSRKWSVSPVQPYVKLPLKTIGYDGSVKSISGGAAFSVNKQPGGLNALKSGKR